MKAGQECSRNERGDRPSQRPGAIGRRGDTRKQLLEQHPWQSPRPLAQCQDERLPYKRAKVSGLPNALRAVCDKPSVYSIHVLRCYLEDLRSSIDCRRLYLCGPSPERELIRHAASLCNVRHVRNLNLPIPAELASKGVLRAESDHEGGNVNVPPRVLRRSA